MTLYIVLRQGTYSADGSAEHAAQHTDVVGGYLTRDEAEKPPAPGPEWISGEDDILEIQVDDSKLSNDFLLEHRMNAVAAKQIEQMAQMLASETASNSSGFIERTYRDAYNAVKASGESVEGLPVPEA